MQWERSGASLRNQIPRAYGGGDRAYAAMGRNNQRIPATPLVAQLVPRHLADRRVLRTSARQVDDDEFLALTPRLRAVASNIANLLNERSLRFCELAVNQRVASLAI